MLAVEEATLTDFQRIEEFRRDVIQLMRDQPGLSTGQIATEMGIDENKLNSRLGTLRKNKLIYSVKEFYKHQLKPDSRRTMVVSRLRWYAGQP